MKLVPVVVEVEYPKYERPRVIVEYDIAPDDERDFPGGCLKIGNDLYRLPHVHFNDLPKEEE